MIKNKTNNFTIIYHNVMILDYNVLFPIYSKMTLTVELFALKVNRRLKWKRNKSLQSRLGMSNLLLLRLRWVHVAMVSNPDQKRCTPDSENCGLTHPSSLSLASAVSPRMNTWWIHPSAEHLCPTLTSHLWFSSIVSWELEPTDEPRAENTT